MEIINSMIFTIVTKFAERMIITLKKNYTIFIEIR